GDEDLAVADLPGAGGLQDGLDDAVGILVRDGELDLGFRQEVHDVLGAAVELRVAALAAEALDLRHRDALYADVRKGFAHVVELERLDDRDDEFHGPLLQRMSKVLAMLKTSCSVDSPTRSSSATISVIPRSSSASVSEYPSSR